MQIWKVQTAEQMFMKETYLFTFDLKSAYHHILTITEERVDRIEICTTNAHYSGLVQIPW